MQNISSFGIRKGGGAGGRAAQEKMEALQRLEARAAKALEAQSQSLKEAAPAGPAPATDSIQPTGVTHVVASGSAHSKEIRAGLNRLDAMLKRREAEFEESQLHVQEQRAKNRQQ